jgi:hypothetical protein
MSTSKKNALTHALIFLRARDLLSISSVCSALHALYTRNILWDDWDRRKGGEVCKIRFLIIGSVCGRSLRIKRTSKKPASARDVMRRRRNIL